MNREEIRNHWYAYVYEQQVQDRDDVDLLLRLLGDAPKRVLEVACGGGRMLVPLARAGHMADGLDADPWMLERLALRAKGLAGIAWRQADAVTVDWGGGYDAVVLGGNILINILSDMPNGEAQRLFLHKAAQSVVPGGYLYLDFNYPALLDKQPGGDWVCFEGTDDRGTHGRFIVCGGGKVDAGARTETSDRRYEIAPATGEPFAHTVTISKHFPTIAQVYGWLDEAGWSIEHSWGDRYGGPLDESGQNGVNAVIWARKVQY